MNEHADRLYERLLVLRCQAGDEAAFAELVERYHVRLRFYLRKLLIGVCEPEDVLQDVWFDVFRGVARLIDADAFRAWLYRVARGRALKEFRKRRLTFQSLGDDDVADAKQDVQALAVDDAQGVYAALDKLPERQREVLVLRYIEFMSYEEIAAVVDCQVGTVRSRLHYAKLALRKKLEREGQHER